jgi:hypothetical protein
VAESCKKLWVIQPEDFVRESAIKNLRKTFKLQIVETAPEVVGGTDKLPARQRKHVQAFAASLFSITIP